MSNDELDKIAQIIRGQGFAEKPWPSRVDAAQKLLRSIEISALREAREVVEKRGDDEGLGVTSILDALTAKIRNLELK